MNETDDAKRPRFETRDVAAMLGVPARRVEGWVERKLLRPTRRGRGPGKRRAFSLTDVVFGKMLLELQKALGERYPHLEALLYTVPAEAPTQNERPLRAGKVGPGVLIAGIALAHLRQPADRRDVVVAIASFADDRQQVSIGIGPDDGSGLGEMQTSLDAALKAGASITMFSLRHLVDSLRARLPESALD